MERQLDPKENGGKRSSTGRPPPGRKAYEKPLLRQVPLRPEEAVLGNCKIAGTSGPASASCSDFVCSSLGS